MEMIELTKHMEETIRQTVSLHDPNGTHTMEYKMCEECAILILLAEIDRLREQNLNLRVNS